MARLTNKSDPYIDYLIKHPELAVEIQRLDEEGRQALRRGNLEEARTVLKSLLALCPISPMGHNNLGAVYFHEGQYEDAAREFRTTLDHYPEYTFALAMLSSCQTAQGDTHTASETLRRAVRSFRPGNPHRGDEADAVSVIVDAFAALNDDRGLFEFVRRSGSRKLPERVWALAGVAAFNLTRFTQAERYWRRAAEKDPRNTLYEFLMAAARVLEKGRIEPFRLPYELRLSPVEDPKDPEMLNGTLKASIIYAVWNGEPKQRSGAIDLLSKSANPWAESFLWQLVLQGDLPTEAKIQAAHALMNRGAIAKDEPITLNIDGEMRKVILKDMVATEGMDPDAVAAFLQGIEMRKVGNNAGAEGSFRKALALEPDFPEAQVNLAILLTEKGEAKESSALLEEVVETYPDFDIARLNLVAHLADAERWDRVAELLAVRDVDEIDEDVRWLYWYWFGELMLRNGRTAEALGAYQTGLRTCPEDKREIFDKAIDWVRTSSHWTGLDRFQEMRRNRLKALLAKANRPGIPLREAYFLQTKDNLLGMARLRGHSVSSGKKKAELVRFLAQDFEERIDKYYEWLDEEEVAALRWLLERSGTAPFEAFAKEFMDLEDEFFWERRDPVSPGVCLWSLGWISVGTWHTKEDGDVGEPPVVVTIPHEAVSWLEEKAHA